MSNKTPAITVGGMIGLTFAGMGIWLLSRPTPERPPGVAAAYSPNKLMETTLPAPEQARPPAPTDFRQTIPAFRTITDTIAYDNPRRSQVEIAVFMEERATEESIRLLLNHLYGLAKKAGPFKYREHPNYILVRIHARKGQEWIAMGFQSAVSEFDIQISNELLKTVNDPSVVKFGFAEAERQMIFRDIVRIEDRAHYEAEQMYPFPMPKNDPSYTETGEKNQFTKQVDYATELMKQYRIELAESLDLTMEQLEEIGNEGVKNWWETPATR